MATYGVRAAGSVGLLVAALAGCSDSAVSGDAATPASKVVPSSSGTSSSPPTSPGAADSGASDAPDPPAHPRSTMATPKPGRARPATVMQLSIPSIRVRGLRVVPYTGTPDDRPGTHIQDRGMAASPRGPGAGIGPGEVGNLIITAHRTTAGRPFGQLPKVRNGAHVLVTSGGLVYDYVINGTMTISFRSARSKALQTAPVPGNPGVRPVHPMITLSTCATPEDHALGNHWKDALGNPEHRIDKIGILVAVRPG
jgi:sortase A